MKVNSLTDKSPAPYQNRQAPLLERRYIFIFALLTTLFFSWALAAQLNDVLIRQFQKALDLSRGQAGFIQTAFFGGYFFGAVPAALFMQKFGYKSGILFGLGLYFFGALMFFPAAEARVYAYFLMALYAIAFGLSFLETAANPYVASLGAKESSAGRLNLAQSFYGVGAFLGPFLGGIFIFSGVEYTDAELAALSPEALEAYRISEAQAVQMPYLAIAAGVAILAIIIAMTKFPKIEEQENAPPKFSLSALLRHRHLKFGAITQFFFVAAQTAIWSYFIDFTIDSSASFSEKDAARLLSFGFIALMVGRFSGAFIIKHWAAEKLLSLYAIAAIIVVSVAMLGSGKIAIYALWLSIFFMSIMFPTIFTLGTRDLGPLTKYGSSLMIMAIIGGAISPPLFGYIADASSIQTALALPIVGYIVVLLYGQYGSKITD